MDYVISKEEETLYNSTGKMSKRLEMIWNDFINKLPESLRKEALQKGFRLIPHGTERENHSSFFYDLKFIIPGASLKLQESIDIDYNIIICMVDPV